MQVRIAAVCAVVLAVAGGCEDTGGRSPCTPFEAEPVDPAGVHYAYVVDSIDMPSSWAEADQLGLDLDGDSQGRPDNALGGIVAFVFSYFELETGLDEEVAALVRAGAILHLLELQTVSFEDAEGVGLTLRHGLDRDGDSDDNFSGMEVFAVDDSRGSGAVSGKISADNLWLRSAPCPSLSRFRGWASHLC